MHGILGWVGLESSPEAASARMTRHLPGARLNLTCDWALAASSHARADMLCRDGIGAAIFGRPIFHDRDTAACAQEQGPAAALITGWRRHGSALPEHMGGTFAFALTEASSMQTLLAIDRSGIERLAFGIRGKQLIWGTRVTALAAFDQQCELDLQALYDYLYFHAVPAPRTIYRGIEKLQPGERLVWDGHTARRDFYWRADYTPQAGSFADRKQAFRAHLDAAVARLDSPTTAAFLSGGTDSSTVVGALTGVRGGPVDTFSIGFDAAGYDEMDYARCAAGAYNSRAHEYYVTPADIVTAIPLIADAYDEPFGNESAVPTYFCAKAAREAGFTQMLAGDGGDEIFGGNARYAKQRLFENYFLLPAALRRGVIEPLTRLPGLARTFPFSKARSYVDQANLRLPLRTESYNFLHRTPLAEIFHADFLAEVDPGATDRALVEVYERTNTPEYVNRMMHLDLKFILADNDLRKVTTMTEAAGVEVAFPLLDDALVAFANALPVDYKVRGPQLRWFFKEALTDLLPEKIRHKSKHGFGLPFGPWCAQHAPLGELVGDSLSDLGRRGWVRPEFSARMTRELSGPHAGYYGSMVWVLAILERWLAAH